MEFDDALDDDDEPGSRWLHPDDRLWRHPSELKEPGAAAPAAHPHLASVGAAASTFLAARSGEPRTVTVAMLAAVIGALMASGLWAVAGGPRIEEVPVPAIQRVSAPVLPVSQGIGSGSLDVVSIAEKIRPAIVQIDVDSDDGMGSGSGVLFRSDGLVLTNTHVVESASTITVILANGRKLDAELVGSDEESDIAVVRIRERGADELPIATLGSATRLKVGQPAVAIGSPLGLEGGPSVTVGVVSALGRTVEAPGKERRPLLDMIQTDAPIAPGSSGGALLDSSGAVIGITTAIAVSEVGAEGLGFATPIDIARQIADQLVRDGKVTHVWLGIEGEDVDAASASRMGVDGGAVVKRVLPNSPAANAGLEASDVILSVDGASIPTMSSLKVVLRTTKPGDAVLLQVRRGTSTRTVRAVLAERRPTDD